MAADTTTHSHPTTVSEPRDAAEDIRVALHRLSSSAPEEFFNIANDLRALGCDDAAVPFYEKAIEAGVPEATYNLALLHHERGRTEIARSCFDFLPTRAALDLAGWEETDIFAHS